MVSSTYEALRQDAIVCHERCVDFHPDDNWEDCD